MAVPRTTTSTFRPDGGGGGDDGRQLRGYHSQIGIRIAGGRRPSKQSSTIEATTRQAGSGKFLLIGAILAVQFVGAAAAMQSSFSNRGEQLLRSHAMRRVCQKLFERRFFELMRLFFTNDGSLSKQRNNR